MTHRTVLITGCLGGIGRALVEAFAGAGYAVIGIDLAADAGDHTPALQRYLSVDLYRLCTEESYRSAVLSSVQEACEGSLNVLINNAAWQVVKPTQALTLDDWNRTQHVNVTAPFLLSQALIPALERQTGCVINIASIHGQLTKPEFVAYATSKTALVGMTRAMAVDLGGRVRVNAICPAAIATPMLVAGFNGREAAFKELASMHPAGRIGQPEEVARTCLLIADPQLGFLTGACISLDGGIGARLHDPI